MSVPLFLIPIWHPNHTSQVDIWSAGVVLYQMLFGRKPFGDGMSADAVLQRGTIAQARSVEFPEKPAVSEACKDLVRRCLTYDPHQRPDAAALLNHSFFAPIFVVSSGGGGSSSSSSSTSGFGGMLGGSLSTAPGSAAGGGGAVGGRGRRRLNPESYD